MSFFRGLFGPSKEEVWQELCRQIGADFVAGGFWKGAKVQAHVKSWTITLDSYAVSSGHTQHVYTRMRAPLCSRGDFRFQIYRKSVFSDIAKRLGMMDIEVGQSVRFDDDFIIQGNDESRVKALFADREVRRLLELQPKIRLELKDDEGVFRHRFPEGVDELCFVTHGILKDVERLKLLFDLFAAVLDQLVKIGVATEEVPAVQL